MTLTITFSVLKTTTTKKTYNFYTKLSTVTTIFLLLRPKKGLIKSFEGKRSIDKRKKKTFKIVFLDKPMWYGRKRMDLELELDLDLVQSPVCSVKLYKPPQLVYL